MTVSGRSGGRRASRAVAAVLALAAASCGPAEVPGVPRTDPTDPNRASAFGTTDCGRPLRPYRSPLGVRPAAEHPRRLAVIGDSTLFYAMYWRRLLGESYLISENTRIGARVRCFERLFQPAIDSADAVLVSLGDNDGRGGWSATDRAVLRRVLRIVDQAGNVPVLWVTPYVAPTSAFGARGHDGAQAFAQALIDHDRDPKDRSRFRLGNPLIVLTWNKVAPDLPRSWFRDGIHPYQLADAVFAETIVPQVDLARRFGQNLDGGSAPWTAR